MAVLHQHFGGMKMNTQILPQKRAQKKKDTCHGTGKEGQLSHGRARVWRHYATAGTGRACENRKVCGDEGRGQGEASEGPLARALFLVMTTTG